ncbi:hypothetical protein phiB1_1_31 [Pseudomonas phage phiB1_1]|uniref:Uncharacterized protein n=1 Tax=Pseudomonas phage phiB1_1 TaxID=2755402 RepID=A0A7D7F1C1_9CAUD|nr:hypothetical protein phiB1_1_31 [Pseudomonas phage phiB1_1]UAW53672.1 hypothetical protein pphageB21_39 [Pseudomonas phage pphageB21]UAW53850.1 hypothetical protein pphageBV72_38 [Pseudomonas phage pphageBV72]
MRFSCVQLPEDSPSTVHSLVSFAWAECIELRWTGGPVEAVQRFCNSVEGHNRFELAAYADDGSLVGGCVLAPDEDQHVGTCLSVMWHYVIPEQRQGAIGRRFMRLAVNCAKAGGFPVLAYSHRIGVGRYEITYRWLHGQDSTNPWTVPRL